MPLARGWDAAGICNAADAAEQILGTMSGLSARADIPRLAGWKPLRGPSMPSAVDDGKSDVEMSAIALGSVFLGSSSWCTVAQVDYHGVAFGLDAA